MRTDDSRRSTNIEDHRGRRMSRPGMKFGLGTIVILIVGYFLGVNPATLLGVMDATQGVSQQSLEPPPQAGTPTDAQADFIAAVLGETEDMWTMIFQQGGGQYTPPKLVLFEGQVNSACGFATSAAGPFYCPGDQRVYIDLAFYDELARNFQAPGDFAQAYVLAHEVGHHVQTLLGISNEVRAAQQRASEVESNQLQVKMELQADCLAGLWAHHADRTRGILEPGDIDEGLRAASAVGDDTIQRRMQGTIVPESFTHGSAEQRMNWFTRGYEGGRLEDCDTFAR